jgi:hypothetical protein
LHIELVTSDSLLDGRDVHPSDIGDSLGQIGWLCSRAHILAVDYGDLSDEDIRGYEPKLIQARFGSPFVFIVGLPGPILTSVASMSLIIYGIKRLWGLPLEFKTHNQRLKERYFTAEARAVEAAARRDAALQRQREASREIYKRWSNAEKPGPRRSPRKYSHAVRTEEEVAAKRRDETYAEVDKKNGWGDSAISKVEEMWSGNWIGDSGSWFVEDD